MYIMGESIIAAASVILALAAIFTIFFAGHRCYLRQNQQDKEIRQPAAYAA